MKRLHGISLIVGLLIGVAASIGVDMYLTRKPVPLAPAPPVPPVVARVAPSMPVPATHLKHRRLTQESQVSLHKLTAKPSQRSNRNIPWLGQQDTFAMPLGDGGIFSGMDPKDPRIYHFAEP
jgi:hypothetical protein